MWIYIVVISLSILFVSRILTGLIIANCHQIKQIKLLKGHNLRYHPMISVIIPAYNEEKLIERCVISVLESDYDNFEIIAVDDGSQDYTLPILNRLSKQFWNLHVVHEPNLGKAAALNHGISVANGDLIMVLDADSGIRSDGLRRMVKYFANPKTLAVNTNVTVDHPRNKVELAQLIEYDLGYRLKGSEPLLNLEYIIGGVGSTFRRKQLLEVGGYDTNCLTEDMDMSLKLLKYFGNKKYIFGYARDVVTFTAPVQTFKGLCKQRYRWKRGRFQALFKYSSLLFNSDRSKYSFSLTEWKLPKIFFEEFVFFLDPAFILLMMYVLFIYGDFTPVISIFALYTVYALSSYLGEYYHIGVSNKQLFKIIPFTIAFVQCTSLADYLALLRCIVHMSDIYNDPYSSEVVKWTHVRR